MSFELFEFFYALGVIFVNFNFDEKRDCSMHLLSLVKTNSGKISVSYLIDLAGMLVFCVNCNILISFKISYFLTNEKLRLYLKGQFSLIPITLRWALYFTIADDNE